MTGATPFFPSSQKREMREEREDRARSVK